MLKSLIIIALMSMSNYSLAAEREFQTPCFEGFQQLTNNFSNYETYGTYYQRPDGTVYWQQFGNSTNSKHPVDLACLKGLIHKPQVVAESPGF